MVENIINIINYAIFNKSTNSSNKVNFIILVKKNQRNLSLVLINIATKNQFFMNRMVDFIIYFAFKGIGFANRLNYRLVDNNFDCN